MKTELKIFNDLIDTIVKNSCNNEANITDVELWAESWREEMSQALAIPVVVQKSEPLKCDQVCDWYSVGHQLNGHQECRTCGKQKAF